MEKEKNNKNEQGIGYYMRRYGNYLILSSVVFVLLVAIVVTSFVSAKSEVEPVNSPAVITFQSPVLNGQIATGYSDTELQYNKALNVWKVHKGIDYVAEIGTNVFCAYDGIVSGVSTDILNGTVVEIDHGEGLKTRYASLDANTLVKVGDTVQKGDIIGKASNTATAETTDFGEVHFEVWKDGNLVDPANYLDLSSGK